MTTIADSATNQAWLLRPDDKTALVLTGDAAPPADPAAAAPKADATIAPTGKKREIDGVSCDEYTVAMKLDIASMLGGGSALPPEAASMLKDVVLQISGSIWASRDAPGAAEFAVFQKTASRFAAAAVARTASGGGGTSIPGGMDRLLTGFPEATGIPYLTELTTRVEGTGQFVALMQQIGQMKITGKVSSISTDAVPVDVFNVPAGYTIVK
jgi:hypothetical protein